MEGKSSSYYRPEDWRGFSLVIQELKGESTDDVNGCRESFFKMTPVIRSCGSSVRSHVGTKIKTSKDITSCSGDWGMNSHQEKGGFPTTSPPRYLLVTEEES